MSHPTASWVLVPSAVDGTFEASTFIPGVDLELDGDGDLVVDRDAHFTTGLDAVAQGIRIRVQMFEGEWFLDLDTGIPYYQDILGQKFNEVKIRAAFREEILAAPGVGALLELAVTFDNATRILSVTWKVQSSFGVVEDSVEV